MTLSVNVYTRNDTGAMQIVEPAEGLHELAGFESYRHGLYGSEAARSLGFVLLPTLAASDIYAEGEQVTQLQREAEIALANIARFELEARTTAEHLRSRFQNIIRACKHAASIGGGVVIW